MDIALRATSNSPTNYNGASAVVPKPTGLTVGDLMIAYAGTEGNSATAHTAEDGWTGIEQVLISGRSRGSLWWKIADADDVAATNFTFTSTGSTQGFIAAISAWYNHDSSSPIGAADIQTNSQSTTCTAPTITPAAANSMIIFLTHGFSGGLTASSYAIATDNPASWTESYDVSGSQGADVSLAMAYALRAKTTATGSGTATLSSSVYNIGGLVAITPAGGSAYERSITTSIGLSSSLNRLAGVNRGLTTAAGLSSTLNRLTNVNRSISTDIGLNATLSRVKGTARDLSTAIGLDTTLTRGAAFNRTASTSIGLTSTISRAATYGRAISTAIGLTSSLSSVKTIIRTLSTAIGMTASITKSFSFNRSISTAIGFVSTLTGALPITEFVYTLTTAIGMKASLIWRGKFKRRVNQIGTNRTIAETGTNREISEAGDNRDVIPW